MFSGIIREIGKVKSLTLQGDTARLGVVSQIFSQSAEDRAKVGDSIAISGVCLTITGIIEQEAFFDLASETRRVTTLGGLTPSSEVNLERSLRFGERLDGHLVQGHVDAIAELRAIEDQGNTIRFEFSVPSSAAVYLAAKGSVAIDGVSLTVGAVEGKLFSVYIIPYTLQETTFKHYRVGTRVNIETDCVARYLEKLAIPYLSGKER